jgi:hypothetical protein
MQQQLHLMLFAAVCGDEGYFITFCMSPYVPVHCGTLPHCYPLIGGM